MSNVFKRVGKNSGIGISGGILVIAAAFVKTLMLGKFLELTDFGNFIICANLVALVKLVVRPGFEATLLRYIPEFGEKGGEEMVASLIWLCVYIATGITILLVSGILIFSNEIAVLVYGNAGLGPNIMILGLATSVYLFGDIFVAMLRLVDKFQYALLPPILGGFLVPLFLYLWSDGGSLHLREAIIATAIGEAFGIMGCCLMGLLYTRSLWSFSRVAMSLEPIRERFRGIRSTLVNTSLFGILNAGSEVGGIFLLGVFGSSAQVAIAGMASQLARPLLILQSSIGTAVNPEVGKLCATNSMRELSQFIKKYFVAVLTAFLAGVVVCWFVAPYFIHLFLKPEYLAALPIFLIFAVSYGLTTACQPFYILAVSRDEIGKRNLLVSLRFVYLAVSVWFGITAMAVALVLLVGNLTVRIFNDLPMYREISGYKDRVTG